MDSARAALHAPPRTHARAGEGKLRAGAQARHNPAPRHVTPPPRRTTWPGRALKEQAHRQALLLPRGQLPSPPSSRAARPAPHSTRRTAVQRKATLFRLHSPAGHFQRIPVQGGAQSQSLALSSLLLQEKAEGGRCGRRKKPHPTLIKTGPLPLPALRGGSGQQEWAVCAPLLPELSCHIL